jgi:hypothetical protein
MKQKGDESMKAYVKKNMGLTIIVSLILMAGVAMFVYNLRIANADTIVLAGDDNFSTGSGSQAQLTFANGDFGAGSLGFTVTVSMVSNAFPDTVVHRDSNITNSGTTNLTLKTLALKSSSPVAVHFSDNSVQYWDISTAPDPSRPSAGTLTLNSDGTGTANLTINYILHMSRNGTTLTKTGIPSNNFGSCNFSGWSSNNRTFVCPPLTHQDIINRHAVQIAG